MAKAQLYSHWTQRVNAKISAIATAADLDYFLAYLSTPFTLH